MAVSAVLTAAGHPLASLLAAFLAGLLAGAVTGLLQTKAGIYPILAGILVMSGLYTVNMFVLGGAPNLAIPQTLFKAAYAAFPGIDKAGRDLMAVGVSFLFAAVCVGILIWFFKTHVGLCIRATGNNEDMVRSSSINSDLMKVLALSLANGLVGLSGAMVAQLQGFADVNAGIGMVVVGIASVIIGEVVFGKRGVTVGLLSCVAGSFLYRLVLAFALRSSFLPAYALKLVSAVIVGAALAIPHIRKSIGRSVRKREGTQNAGH
jgi:putative ABC transport system permease protein